MIENSLLYLLPAIGVIALVTLLTRALPFIIFGNRELPSIIKYLGRTLPAAIMVILVIYCLKNTDVINPPHGIPELAAVGFTTLVHLVKKNMYISIIAGSICYMILIRLF